MSDKFFLARNDRDAWAAIRGYTYQIDRTLISWLKLSCGEALELECGEDIDLLAPSVLAEGSDLPRTLEQVKCLDRTVTLRSASTRAALCSFADHLHENPTLALRFRFLTNALPGEESPASPLLFVPGIQLWEDIRRVEVTRKNGLPRLSQSAYSFRVSTRPRLAVADAWRKVVAATRDPARLSAVIANFEWATGAGGPHEAAEEVERLIIGSGYAGTKVDAKAQHDQLFVFVLRMLGERTTEKAKTGSI